MQEVYKQKRKKKAADCKIRQATTRKAARKPTARATESSDGQFERGGEYKPGMEFRKDMDQKTKSEFLRLRGAYHATGTKAAKANIVKSTKQMLEDAKSDE